MQGVSMSELAKRLDITQQAVSRQLGGDIRLTTIEKIANALGVPVHSLFLNPQILMKIPESFTDNAEVLRCPQCNAPLLLTKALRINQ